MYQLYGSKGCGSAIVEAMLEMLSIPYKLNSLNWDDRHTWQPLEHWNPLVQIPTLIIDDGQVLTESAAIILWLLDRFPNSGLIPAGDSPERAMFYRWLVFVPTNIYAAIGVGDFPDRWVSDPAAQKDLKEKSLVRVKAYWQMIESALQPAPYLLGNTMTALDIYVAMVSHWRLGPAWLEASCPKIASAIRLAEKHPVVAKVWQRNFD